MGYEVFVGGQERREKEKGEGLFLLLSAQPKQRASSEKKTLILEHPCQMAVMSNQSNKKGSQSPGERPTALTGFLILPIQTGARGHRCGHQHESGRTFRQRALWRDWSSEMAV